MEQQESAEKRLDGRDELNRPARVSMDGSVFQCTIRNFSQRGALLCMDRSGQECLSHDLMGNEICFDDAGELPGIFKNRGRIIRFIDDGESVYMAVCFI